MLLLHAAFGTNEVLFSVDMAGKDSECFVALDIFLLFIPKGTMMIYWGFTWGERTPGDGNPFSIPSTVAFYPFVLQQHSRITGDLIVLTVLVLTILNCIYSDLIILASSIHGNSSYLSL